MQITILFPTQTEASLFKRDGVTTVISGVGLTATAVSTLKIIHEQKPDILILAGIAGVFPHAPFHLREVVLVESEVEGDLGFFTPYGFVHLAHLPIDMQFERRHTLLCPFIPGNLPNNGGFQTAKSVSVNAAMASFIDNKHVDIENMEGAAFFYTCLQSQQRFLQLRAISNVVQVGNDEWDMLGSVRALTDGLHRLIDQLQNQQVS